MSGIVLRSIYNAALKRHIPIELATQLKGYNRLPNVIDENLKKIALDLTERAFNKLSPGYQANIQKIVITRLMHESDNDLNNHCSLLLEKEGGNFYATWHVTTNPDHQTEPQTKQQAD
ncbi:hypothetical protein FQN50_007861 [Emmonsiellopsis sp. PD_5]|nr:hypothetical protein FQN50_007861 [Emmonsiellopsis sp. PD_5]